MRAPQAIRELPGVASLWEALQRMRVEAQALESKIQIGSASDADSLGAAGGTDLALHDRRVGLPGDRGLALAERRGPQKHLRRQCE